MANNKQESAPLQGQLRLKKTILEQIPKLSQEELKGIIAACKFSLKSKSDNSKINQAEKHDEEILFTILSDKLYEMSKGKKIAFYAFTKSTSYDALEGTVKFLNEYLREIHAGYITNSLKQRFFILYSNLMLKTVQEWGIPVNMKTVLQNTDKFPSILDNAFPGYIKSGLMKFILEKQT